MEGNLESSSTKVEAFCLAALLRNFSHEVECREKDSGSGYLLFSMWEGGGN